MFPCPPVPLPPSLRFRLSFQGGVGAFALKLTNQGQQRAVKKAAYEPLLGLKDAAAALWFQITQNPPKITFTIFFQPGFKGFISISVSWYCICFKPKICQNVACKSMRSYNFWNINKFLSGFCFSALLCAARWTPSGLVQRCRRLENHE